MSRLCTFLVALLILATGACAPAMAQPATPTATAALGTPVSVVGSEGTELGQVNIAKLVNPFEAYDPNSPPHHGYHFILVTLSVHNTGNRPFTVDPSQLLLQDADGFLYGPTSVRRSEQAIAAAPDLTHQDLAPGSVMSGVVGFEFLNGAQLADVLYQRANGQILVLAGFGHKAPALGATVSAVGPEGTEVGRLTISKLVDPFEAYDPSSPPQRGGHFVLLGLTARNTGTRTLTIDPQQILLQDANGFLYAPTGIRRPEKATASEPDLTRQDLSPGSQISGDVGFTVLNGAKLARVYYQPANDQFVVLADLVAGVPSAGPGGATPAASPGATPVGATECAGVKAWITGTVENVKKSVTYSQVASDPSKLSRAQLQGYVDKFAALAKAQQQLVVPASAAAMNQKLVSIFQAYGEALKHVINAGQSGNIDELTTGANMFNQASSDLQAVAGQIDQLATTCNISL